MEPLPERIGAYRVIERLAHGGMAEVLLADVSGASGFSRRVVIKRVLPQFSQDAAFVEMFRDEAHITAQLHHGNIAQMLDFGQEDGRYYIVLEHVNGPSLASVLRSLAARGSRLSIPEVAHVTVEVARALDYAHHKRGADGASLLVVHRDVSPSNILLSREGEVKLTDFGIARARARVAPITQVGGALKGKIPYMPAEALRGKTDARSDLYALGAVVYEMLTGQLAFGGDSEIETVQNILTHTVARVSSFDPAIPPVLDEMVERLLAMEPNDRPQRGLELVEALSPLTIGGAQPATEMLAATLERLQRPSGERAAPEQTVLVVDQSRTMRALLRKHLRPELKAIDAASSDEAHELLRELRPAAIVSQSSLPGTTGVALCTRIREDPALAAIPFVLLAAEVTPELERAARDAGVAEVVPKQDVPSLKAVLRRLIASR